MTERILGLDIGDRTLGVAVSDPLGFTAQGVCTIRRTKLKEDFEKLDAIVRQRNITRFVLGLPKNMNNTLGPQGNKVKQFAAQMKKKWDLPIEFQDERLSTVAAEQMMAASSMHWKKRKELVDEVAAQLILQRWLDAKSRKDRHEHY